MKERISKLQIEILYHLNELTQEEYYASYTELLKSVAFSNPKRHCSGIDAYGYEFKRPYSSFRVSFNRSMRTLMEKGLVINIPSWMIWEEEPKEINRIRYLMMSDDGKMFLNKCGQNELTISVKGETQNELTIRKKENVGQFKDYLAAQQRWSRSKIERLRFIVKFCTDEQKEKFNQGKITQKELLRLADIELFRKIEKENQNGNNPKHTNQSNRT